MESTERQNMEDWQWNFEFCLRIEFNRNHKDILTQDSRTTVWPYGNYTHSRTQARVSYVVGTWYRVHTKTNEKLYKTNKGKID